MVLENLEPKIVWKIFENIVANTPRPSKHEEKIRKNIKEFISKTGKENNINFEIFQDSVGNILIKKPGTKGRKSDQPLMLQAHFDMVCETDKPEGYDFFNKGIPIRIQENSEWIDADGTSLGADNGIGLAYALAILTDKSLDSHGPIEVLFTVNEEDGFDGATLLDPAALNIKSKLMINLDGGPAEVIVIGSVCGRRIRFSRNFSYFSPKENNNLQFFELSCQGLLSGHSGEDIDLPRANAIKIIGRILSIISQAMKIHISKWKGGTKGNVIPAQSTVIFAIKSNDIPEFKEIIDNEINLINNYFQNFEPNMKIDYKQSSSDNFLSDQDSLTLISTIHLIPSGVLKKSHIYEDVIESSNNLSIINTEKRDEIIWIYPRSMIRSELNSFCVSMKQLGQFGNWKVFLRPVLPEWLPDLESDFLNYVKKQYEIIINKPPRYEVVHGGLETGMISTRIKNLQMVSLGPTLEGLHSPSERLKIADVSIVYQLLKNIVLNLAELNNLTQ